MSKRMVAKTLVAAGGWIFLGMAPEASLGQSSVPGAGPAAPSTSAMAAAGKSAAPLDLLEGLTLADEQQARISQIREDTKARLAALERDKELSPEAADAMRRGYQRLENGRILEVLTPEQQKQVRSRVAAWRTAQGKAQYPERKSAGSGQDPGHGSP